VSEVNDALLEMTGLTRAEVIGQNAFQLNLQVDPAVRAAMGRELQEHGVFRNKEVQIRLPTGENRHLLNSGALITLGGRPHNLALLWDITERKRTEAQLQALAGASQ